MGQRPFEAIYGLTDHVLVLNCDAEVVEMEGKAEKGVGCAVTKIYDPNASWKNRITDGGRRGGVFSRGRRLCDVRKCM